MSKICELSDATFGFSGPVDGEEQNREACRAVVFNQKGEVAVLHTEKHGHHKLPGGGVEEGEDKDLALVREVAEEAGCKAEIENFIGEAIEHRNQHNFHQVSYCYKARWVEDLETPELTDDEKADGYTPAVWVPIEEAIKMFEQDKPKTYIGTFMHARDFAILKAALKDN